jgi:phosphatidate phosphatase APP1
VRAGWQPVELELIEDLSVKAIGRVLVPPDSARFAVVSDIDDTVVYSHVTHKLRMLLTIALSNARTRKPFQGVAADCACRATTSARRSRPCCRRTRRCRSS